MVKGPGSGRARLSQRPAGDSEVDAMEITRCRQVARWCAVVAGMAMTAGAHADPIDDRSFFDSIPHTFLDFETKADGSPVNVADGAAEIMDFNEYEPLGVRWNGLGTAFWGNDSDPDSEAALAAGGSPNHVVGWANGVPGMVFGEPIRSLGFALFVNTAFVTEPIEIRASLFDGTIVESVFFDPMAPDGQVGDISFGFVGLTSESPFQSILIFQDDFFSIDDLHFSSVPAPGGVALFSVGVSTLSRRKR